jgi:hypothetical protein
MYLSLLSCSNSIFNSKSLVSTQIKLITLRRYVMNLTQPNDCVQVENMNVSGYRPSCDIKGFGHSFPSVELHKSEMKEYLICNVSPVQLRKPSFPLQ